MTDCVIVQVLAARCSVVFTEDWVLKMVLAM